MAMKRRSFLGAVMALPAASVATLAVADDAEVVAIPSTQEQTIKTAEEAEAVLEYARILVKEEIDPRFKLTHFVRSAAQHDVWVLCLDYFPHCLSVISYWKYMELAVQWQEISGATHAQAIDLVRERVLIANDHLREEVDRFYIF